MPAIYAHYRFGVEVLKQMPGDIRRTVNRFRRLYDVGLHGPDIFFYYNPLRQTKAGSLGSRLHRQSGKDFFTRACRGLRMEPSQAGEAYLYGLLTHYCLDTFCHPYISEKVRQGEVSHVEIEAEFERFLLERDGKTPACSQDLSPHMQLTDGECQTAAGFYTGVKPGDIRAAVKSMALITKSLAVPAGARRNIMRKGIGLFSQTYAGVIIPEEENPKCGMFNEELLAQYEKAREQFPALLLQLSAHLTYNAPFGEEFASEFG